MFADEYYLLLNIKFWSKLIRYLVYISNSSAIYICGCESHYIYLSSTIYVSWIPEGHFRSNLDVNCLLNFLNKCKYLKCWYLMKIFNKDIPEDIKDSGRRGPTNEMCASRRRPRCLVRSPFVGDSSI